MKVLVINCGSSSLKYQLIDMSTEESLAQGLVERIGIEGSVLTQKVEGRDKYIIKQPMADHKDAIKLVLEALVDEKNGVISSMDEISAVGHRVVHGGEKFASSVVITDEVEEAIKACNDLAPLHNPANLMGIDAMKTIAKEGKENPELLTSAPHNTIVSRVDDARSVKKPILTWKNR